MAVEALKKISPDAGHIELGHAGLFKALTDELEIDAGARSSCAA